MKNSIFYFLLVSAILSISCSQIETEYSIDPKKTRMKEELCYVDGFLVKDTPIPDTDIIAVAITNGFGRNLRFEFNDYSDKYGFKVVGGIFTSENIGEVQYAKFAMEGTPSITGNVPITYQVYEGDSDESLFGTLSSNIYVWEAGTTRPPKELIPTAEKPFIFIKGEILWNNMYPEQNGTQRFMYNREGFLGVNNFTVNGINYGMPNTVIQYNSIWSKQKVISPEVKLETVNGKQQWVMSCLYPTSKNLSEHPEWFTLKDGTLSTEWGTGDRFMHGSTAKAVTSSIYDENAVDITNGTYSCRPFSTFSWSMINWNANNPLGSYISKPGTYKIYVKYINKDASYNVADYLPKHPETGEAGWVPYEFTISPAQNFVFDPSLDATDWEPTADEPIKAIRAELVEKVGEMTPFSPKAGEVFINKIIRVWFVTYKDVATSWPTTYNFKPVSFTVAGHGVAYGGDTNKIKALAGEGSKISAGIGVKPTNTVVKYFADELLNEKYALSYDELTTNNNTKLVNPGEYRFEFEIEPAGANPIPYKISAPLRITVKP